MFGQLDLSVIKPSLGFIWTGLLFSTNLTLIAMIGGIVIGTLLAMARLASLGPLARLASRGHPVAPGWVVGTRAYRDFLETTRLDRTIQVELGRRLFYDERLSGSGTFASIAHSLPVMHPS